MKVITTVILLMSLIKFSYFLGETIGQFTLGDSKNKITLERVLCTTYPKSKISQFTCKVKHIDRHNIKVAVLGNISETIHEIYAVVRPYFKFNRYTRIAGNIYGNLCDWFIGKSHFITDFYMKKLMKYANANHSCPYYPGQLILKADNLSVQQFAFPQIMPAGRYRLDINLTEADSTTAHCSLTIYCSISDHRIEIV